MRLSQPSKPALRVSGSSTPILQEPAEGEIIDHEGKTRSLNVARDKAHRLSKSLGEGTENDLLSSEDENGQRKHRRSDDKRRKRSKSPRRGVFELFHDGNEDMFQSGQTTPDYDDADFVPRPVQYRATGLSAMALLDRVRGRSSHSRRSSFDEENASGRSTPTLVPPGFSRSPRHSPSPSLSSIASLVTSSYAQGGSIAGSRVGGGLLGQAKQAHSKRPSALRSHSDGEVGESGTSTPIPKSSSLIFLDGISKASRKPRSSSSRESSSRDTEALVIKKHIQETRSRQIYLLKLSRALMAYGAPTHRLEEYMRMSARTLDIEAQFLYLPGCMVISFDDTQTHTTEMKLIRNGGGIDLGKLRDVHDVYKEVVHDHMGESPTVKTDRVLGSKN